MKGRIGIGADVAKRAQRTLSEQAGVTGKSPFHISLAGSNPFAPEYRDLVNTVAKYRAQFVNTEFLGEFVCYMTVQSD